MLIKGVTGGKDKGNPIEYSPEEKFPLAIEKFLNTKAPEGKLYLFQKSELADTGFSSNGPSTNNYANNTYSASGKVWYKVHELETDKLRPAIHSDFVIEFRDGTDHMGVPDIELVKLEMQ